jgi:hypothetical protein
MATHEAFSEQIVLRVAATLREEIEHRRFLVCCRAVIRRRQHELRLKNKAAPVSRGRGS